jgi:nucleoid-associated protein EbfC
MLGALGNIGTMLKQAKSLQENMQKMQAELLRKRFDAEAGAGLVKAIVDGKGDLVQIKIDPKATGDVELLEDMIKAAIGAAAQKARESAGADIAQLTGGMNIPGLTDLLGQGAK